MKPLIKKITLATQLHQPSVSLISADNAKKKSPNLVMYQTGEYGHVYILGV